MTTDVTIAIESKSPEATETAAQEFGRACSGGEVFLLIGPLGAGKTRFVRGLLAGLGGDPRRAKSPTFGVMHRYPAAARSLVHCDAYFVRDPLEFARAGLDEFLAAKDVVAVEWPDRVAGAFPRDALEIAIAITGDESRKLVLTAKGPCSEALIRRFNAGRPSP